MRIHLFNICFLLLLLPLKSQSQDQYWVGVGKASIEPGEDFFSLALQGYGDPPEGRFTIEWKKKGVVLEPKSITGSGQTLYSLMPNGDLWKVDTKSSNLEWGFVGATNTVFRLAGADPNSFKMIAGDDDKLYAISLNNKLSVYNTNKTPMQWKKIGETADAIALTASQGKIYLATSGNELLLGNVDSEVVMWKKAGFTKPETVSITACEDRIYLLTRSQRIWEGIIYDNEVKWTEIAYINGSTYSQALSHIAVSENRLYGVGLDNNLYLSNNKTKGDLSVRAITIKSGDKTIALVGADLAAIDYDFGVDVKEEIFKETGIPSDAVMLNSSHTHFSPVSKLWYAFGDFGHPDQRYLDKIKRAIVDAVKQASLSMDKSVLYFGRTETNIGMNRSLQGEDSKLYDSDLDIIKIETPEGKIRSVLFLASCHPVFPYKGEGRFTISANFPGVSRQVIENNLNCKHSLFLQACGGDINPRIDNDETLGSILAFDVLKRMENPMKKISGKITFKLDSLLVPFSPWSKEKLESFKKENSNKTGDIEAEKNVRWANGMLDHYNRNNIKTNLPVYIQTFDIGDWKLIGLSREPVSEYGLEIKKLYPKKQVTVAGYNNDVSSYLPTAKHIQTGTYEGTDSFFWYGESAVFPLDILQQVINKIKTEKY